MIGSHLAQLRRVVDESQGLPESTRAELLRLVDIVESEMTASATSTSATDIKESSSIEDGDQVELKSSDRALEDANVLDQLRQSIEELEATHPEAAAAVNRVATVLANMGI